MNRVCAGASRRIALVLGVATVALALMAMVPVPSLAQGCAMCGTYLSNGTDPRTDAFKVSILFMMSMPILCILSAGGWILWMHWRSRPRVPALRVVHAEEEGAS